MSSTALPRIVCAASVAPEILAFYYGWYGNPQISGEWRHWKNVDPVTKRVENVTDYPAYGTYDSHDSAGCGQGSLAGSDTVRARSTGGSRNRKPVRGTKCLTDSIRPLRSEVVGNSRP
jgi:hypothetical protein